MAVTDIFWLSALLFVLLIGLVWMTQPRRAAGPMADGGAAH